MDMGSIIQEIEEMETGMRARATDVRRKNPLSKEEMENFLVKATEPCELNCIIGGVDGGVASEEFHGFDLVLVKAVGVVYQYSGNSLKKYSYHPTSLPEMKMDSMRGLEKHEVQWHKSLCRLYEEIKTARELAEKSSMDYLLLDGSIVPQVGDKPNDSSQVKTYYLKTLDEYLKLYRICEERKICLIGAIKDSRGRRFMELIGESSKVNDTVFLDFLLKEGERTFGFHYGKTEIIKDLAKFGEKIHCFYIKPVKEDRPLRIEVFNGNFDKVASLIHSLCSINKRYASPAILIEADMRAAIRKDELDRIYGDLYFKLGNKTSVMRLRRNERPFR